MQEGYASNSRVRELNDQVCNLSQLQKNGGIPRKNLTKELP